MLSLAFFLLPGFIYFSILLNALGYYLVLFVIPFLVILAHNYEFPRPLLNFFGILFVLYLLFPLSNIINWLRPDISLMGPSFYKFSWVILFHSSFPKSYFFTFLLLGVLWFLLLGLRKLFTIFPEKKPPFRSCSPFESFLNGMVFFSFIYLIYYGAGVLWNLDYRLLIKLSSWGAVKNYFLQQIRLCDSFCFMRSSGGLLANPLTLSSMTLAFFTFFYGLFFYGKQQYKWKCLVIALCNLTILTWAMGRTSIAIGFMVFVIFPFVYYVRRKDWKGLGWVGLASGLLGLVILTPNPIHDRFSNTLHKILADEVIDNRTYFRHIYFQIFADKPFFGQGSYWLRRGVTDRFYVNLGFANLNERNYPAHNVYLQVLSAAGLIGALVIVFGCFKLVLWLRQYGTSFRYSHRNIALLFLLAVFVNLLHALTQNNFFEGSTCYVYLYLVMVLFWDRYFCEKKDNFLRQHSN